MKKRTILTFILTFGLLKEESFSPANVKNGMWKWYKNGKLINTKKHKDNKLVETIKYGA